MDDVTAESDVESFMVTVIAIEGSISLTQNSSATVSIEDNDRTYVCNSS